MSPILVLGLGVAAIGLGVSVWEVFSALRRQGAPSRIQLLAALLVVAMPVSLIAAVLQVASPMLFGLSTITWVGFALRGHLLWRREPSALRHEAFIDDFDVVAQAIRQDPSPAKISNARAAAEALDRYRDDETAEFIDLVQAEVEDWATGRVGQPETGIARRRRILERGDKIFGQVPEDRPDR